MEQGEHINLLLAVATRQAEKESKIQTLYLSWEKDCSDILFTELITLMDSYCISWIRKQLWKSNCYTKDNEETILQESRLAIWENMNKGKIVGRVENFAKYGFGLYRNKTFGFIDGIYRKRKQEAFSMNAPIDDDGEMECGDTIMSKEILDPVLEAEKKTMYKKMFYIYCSSFMNATTFPPRILALYYARILPHLLSIEWGWKTIPDTKATSAKWAFERMGKSTIDELRLDSERTIQFAIAKTLRWSDAFVNQLEEEVVVYNRRDILKDVVYTSVYDKGKIEDWADYMHRVTVKVCMRKVSDEPELLELTKEYISKKDVLYSFIKGGT